MEKLVQYLWQHRLFNPEGLTTVDGQPVEVVDQGLLNNDAGPDFFNAKIKIGERIWAGNVEIHMRASDWFRHGHQHDPAYNSVILHVVTSDDARISRPDGNPIPQLVLPVAKEVPQGYLKLTSGSLDSLACADVLKDIDTVHVNSWITALGYERLQAKAARVAALAAENNGDWGQAIFIVLARALGFGVNAEPFERLARALPLRYMRRHAGMPATLEAFLFGQSGLLDHAPQTDPYVQFLQSEYAFLAAKYALPPVVNLGWKMARMRPYNFPYRRIAAIAAMLANGLDLAYSINSVNTLEQARALFRVQLSDYWQTRFSFTASAPRATAALSATAIDLLVVNVVVPVIYAASRLFGYSDADDKALELITQIGAERNSIVSLFGAAGIGCSNAFESQALIQLRNEYCSKRKCLYCRFGHKYLSRHTR